MKAEKLIRELRAILDADARERRRRHDELKTLLHRMRSKERHLMSKAAAEDDTEVRERLRQEIDSLHAQRRKGLELLRTPDA